MDLGITHEYRYPSPMLFLIVRKASIGEGWVDGGRGGCVEWGV